MNKAIRRFEDFWRGMDLTSKSPYVHPMDERFFRANKTDGLQLELLPIPMNGNLRHADIIILMLNSGFSKDDINWESAHPEQHLLMLESQRRNIHQSHKDHDYPFYDLNPTFKDHPGAAYWKGGANMAVKRRQQQKLASVAGELVRVWKVELATVYREISNRIAVLQLFPYRSSTFGHSKLLRNLPSCLEATMVVRALVEDSNKLIVVPRSVKAWGFNGVSDNTENLIIYEPHQARSASLSMNSSGGKAIFNRLTTIKA
ncbi:MAG: hypothetical protein Q8M93_00615 [Polaromonas sp.]|uniref:hypothetical protein n=1 Tax=Polaromonas sp. TaxID=1869339 RepID=UPI00272FF7ED|nr:hypothetical protein [Polaromonas sp.]MDP2448518.1 hypothetical protein [Polaromonas sp.]MDP3245454.1 hypothetical protein [Polaromonas sp.]MDP3754941.1 hypothetical protein [Polaromonas sp.]